MSKSDMQFDVPDRRDRSDEVVAAEAIGDALEETLRPITVEALPRRMVDAIRGLEDAEDWRWVRG